MKKKYLFSTVLLLLFIIFTEPLFSQTDSSNPFYKGTENSSVSKSMRGKPGSFIEKISVIQKTINSRISTVITDYRTDKNMHLLLYIAGFAFIYGLIHAMTPGHGKNIILAWIMTSEKTFIKVLLTAVTGMFLHVFNSVVMVYLIWYIIKGKISVQSPLFIKYFSFAAFIILFIISFRSIYEIFTSRHNAGHENEDKTEHKSSHDLEKIKSSTTLKECFLIALGIGIVPCPVAAILTVFMISGELFAESFLTAAFFSAGMTLTLVSYTAAVWVLRSFISGLKNRHLIKIRDLILPAAGSILLMFSGFIIIAPYLSL